MKTPPIIKRSKICIKCKEEKPIEDFSLLKNSPDGFEYKCRKCVSEYGLEYRKRRPEIYERAKQRHKDFMKEYTKIAWQRDKLNPKRLKQRKDHMDKWRTTLKGRFVCWRKSAKKRGIEWSLSFEDIENIPLICFYTGEVLSLESHLHNTLSLDRIDNNICYTKDNVVFCGKLVNNMKNTQTKEKFIHMCRLVAKNFEDGVADKKGAKK